MDFDTFGPLDPRLDRLGLIREGDASCMGSVVGKTHSPLEFTLPASLAALFTVQHTEFAMIQTGMRISHMALMIGHYDPLHTERRPTTSVRSTMVEYEAWLFLHINGDGPQFHNDVYHVTADASPAGTGFLLPAFPGQELIHTYTHGQWHGNTRFGDADIKLFLFFDSVWGMTPNQRLCHASLGYLLIRNAVAPIHCPL